MKKNFSFFEVPEDSASKVVQTFKGLFVEDRKLIVEIAQDGDNNSNSNSNSNYNKKSFDKRGKRPKQRSY